jgi:hypothetical protein
MTWRWPWSRKHKAEGNGQVAADARRAAERRLAEQRRKWPEVLAARDELARLAVQALKGDR